MNQGFSRSIGFDASGALELRESALSIGSDATAIRIDYAGVCGTDLAMIRGDRPERPWVLGHEAVGRLVASRAAALAANTYVAFNPVSPIDQHVTLGHTVDGVWCDRKLVSAGDAHHLVPIEFGELGAVATLVEPLSTAIYACDLAGSCGEMNEAAIFGTGPIALLILQELRLRGVERLKLVGRNAARMAWAVDSGVAEAAELLPMRSLEDDIIRSQACDAVFVCLTRPASLQALPQAVSALREGGALVLVGGISDGDSSPAIPAVNDLNAVRRANSCGRPWPGHLRPVKVGARTIMLTGHRGSSPEQLRRAAARLRWHGDRFRRLITHILSPDEAVALLPGYARGAVSESSGRHIVKAVIDFAR